MWGAYHLAAPSKDFPADYIDLQSDPVYPVHTVPDQKISAQDLFRYHRYTYQGTKYDLSAPGNMAAGPFGTPDRWKPGDGEKIVPGNWERAIGLYRTSDTYVVQTKKSDSKNWEAILWYAPASALGTVFTPFVVSMKDIPASFRSGHHAVFSRESAFWAACVVHNIANLKWSYMIQDIGELQSQLEASSLELVETLFSSRESMEVEVNLSAIHQSLLENADKVVASLWGLSDKLLFKYASGFVNEPPHGMSQMKGYPAWWLQAVGYQEGPPPPPTAPKCCNPDKAPESIIEAPSVPLAESLTGKAAMRQYLRLSASG